MIDRGKRKLPGSGHFQAARVPVGTGKRIRSQYITNCRKSKGFRKGDRPWRINRPGSRGI